MDQTLADKIYEHSDHLFRDQDHYAHGKYQISKKWLLEWKELTDLRLLNVGCGAGHFNQLAHQLKLQVTGIEPDPRTAQLARERSRGTPVQVIEGTMDSIPASEKFDIVVTHDVMEHVAEDDSFAKGLQERLNPSGLLILSVPALPVLFGLHDDNLGHYRRYTKKTLTQVLSPYFHIDKIRYYGFIFIPITYGLSVLLRKPYPTQNSIGGFMEKIIRFICKLETWWNPPLGTGLIVKARPKQ